MLAKKESAVKTIGLLGAGELGIDYPFITV